MTEAPTLSPQTLGSSADSQILDVHVLPAQILQSLRLGRSHRDTSGDHRRREDGGAGVYGDAVGPAGGLGVGREEDGVDDWVAEFWYGFGLDNELRADVWACL